jgi:hypothetical protein
MKKTIVAVSVIAALAFQCIASAQYTRQADIDRKLKAEQVAAIDWYVNRKFWVTARPKAQVRMPFYEKFPDSYVRRDGGFHVDKDTSFTVIEKFDQYSQTDPQYLGSTIFSVQFEDGMEGFVFGSDMERTEDNILGHLAKSWKSGGVMEYVYEQPPQKLKAKVAAIPKKQGVTIGMTQDQVRASSWGRPREVNRTTTSNGVREQWVYSPGNYLYFTDGILTAIQN